MQTQVNSSGLTALNLSLENPGLFVHIFLDLEGYDTLIDSFKPETNFHQHYCYVDAKTCKTEHILVCTAHID